MIIAKACCNNTLKKIISYRKIKLEKLLSKGLWFVNSKAVKSGKLLNNNNNNSSNNSRIIIVLMIK